MNAAQQSLLERVEMPVSINDQMLKFLLANLPDFQPPTDAAAWTRQARRLRRKIRRDVYLRGWPKKLIDRKPPVAWGKTLRPHKDYVIRKLRYEIYPDFWIPALLYVPTKLTGKVPVALNPNGHHSGGKAVSYKQARCINIARRGMIALSFEFIGMGELTGDWPHNDRAIMEMTGLSYTGFFYMAMSKALDVLLAQPHADPKRCVMTGLSGGGWQTIILTALDERITHAVPVAGYMSMKSRLGYMPDVGDWEQIPPDLGLYADYQLLTAMVAPRPLLQILNDRDDCCFRTDRTKSDIHDDVRPTFEAYGAGDDFEFYNNTDPGTHNYDADNRSRFYQFLNKHFDLDLPTKDLHSENELYSELELNVGLPAEQSSILQLTRRRARKVICALKTPRASAQKQALRKKIADTIRLCEFEATVVTAGKAKGAKLFRLKTGAWEMPAAVIQASGEKHAELVISADHCLGQMHAETSGRGTVVLADVMGTGRCHGKYRICLTMQATGQQMLGIGVGQLLAAARFAARQAGVRKVNLFGQGWMCSMVALFAAALEPKLFESVTLDGNFNTLQNLCDQCVDHYEIQALIVPDIMKVCDVPQLIALLEGVKLRQPGRAVPDVN